MSRFLVLAFSIFMAGALFLGYSSARPQMPESRDLRPSSGSLAKTRDAKVLRCLGWPMLYGLEQA